MVKVGENVRSEVTFRGDNLHGGFFKGYHHQDMTNKDT